MKTCWNLKNKKTYYIFLAWLKLSNDWQLCQLTVKCRLFFKWRLMPSCEFRAHGQSENSDQCLKPQPEVHQPLESTTPPRHREGGWENWSPWSNCHEFLQRFLRKVQVCKDILCLCMTFSSSCHTSRCVALTNCTVKLLLSFVPTIESALGMQELNQGWPALSW